MKCRGFRMFASMVRRPVWTSTHWRHVLIVEGWHYFFLYYSFSNPKSEWWMPPRPSFLYSLGSFSIFENGYSVQYRLSFQHPQLLGQRHLWRLDATSAHWCSGPPCHVEARSGNLTAKPWSWRSILRSRIDCSYMFKNNLRLFQLCDVIQNAHLDSLRKSIQGYSKHFIMALSARVELWPVPGSRRGKIEIQSKSRGKVLSNWVFQDDIFSFFLGHP